MTIETMSKVLYKNAQQRAGIVGNQKFGVDQGPFEESDKKYVAYLIDDYKGDYFFNTLEEFLKNFIINNKPIGEQLANISDFYVILCNN